MEISEDSTTQRIITIPIDVIKRQTSQTIKNASAQLKIRQLSAQNSLELVVACEEGLFSGVYDNHTFSKFKTNSDLKDELWLSMLESLLNVNLFKQEDLLADYSNVVLRGRLYSLESYDVVNGQLLDTDLSQEAPEFELHVKSEGVLSVIFGAIPIQGIDPDSCLNDDYDMLAWILIATSQIDSLRASLFKFKEEFQAYKVIAEVKEREVVELNADYQLILSDLQDRFFQVLNEKKIKIQELEGDSVSNLELLNNDYVKRSKLNLNRVNIEDIVINKESMQYKEKRKRKLVKPLKNTRSQSPRGPKNPTQKKSTESNDENQARNASQSGEFNKGLISEVVSNDIVIKTEKIDSPELQLSDTDYEDEREDNSSLEEEEEEDKIDFGTDKKDREVETLLEKKLEGDVSHKPKPRSQNIDESDQEDDPQINSDNDVSTEYSD